MMGHIKGEVEQIVGRCINGVVIKRQKCDKQRPATQLFLLFDDGNYYEFYTDSDGTINTTSGVAAGSLGGVLHYMSDCNEPIYVTYQE